MDTLLRLDLALAHLEAHLLTGLRQVEPFSIGVPAIDGKLADYQAELTALCTRARAGEIERADFEREMEAIVNAALEAFFLTGAETDTIPFDAINQIGEEKYIALRSIRNLANDIYDGRYSEQKEDDEVTQTDEAGLLMLENRVSLWAGTAAGLYAMGMTFLEASQRLVWSYGGTIEHCEDCARLVGQVHTALEWRLSGWRPQSRALSCGGWKCLCLFRKTNKPKQGSF